MTTESYMPMVTVVNTAPTVEPVSLQEMKEHLLLDSGSFDDNLTPTQSLVPDSYAVVVGYTHLGTGVDVLGFSVTVILDSGESQAGSKCNVKIQDSDDNVAFSDWTGGAFTEVSTANDNAIQQIEYTGSKQYIRVIASVTVAVCEFGVTVAKYSSDTTQDSLLSTIITASRQNVEAITQRKLITQTWDGYFDAFPAGDSFLVPFGQIQAPITHLKYTDSDGTETTMTVTTEYLVDSSSEPGRVVLPYGVSWPSFTPYPVNPITIRWITGYGAAASDVPAGIKTAIKMIGEDLFNYRDSIHELLSGGSVVENKAVMAMLWQYRLWTEM